jgi:hypothetical protein
MSRHHVHLSKDIATAQTVDTTHGKAVCDQYLKFLVPFMISGQATYSACTPNTVFSDRLASAKTEISSNSIPVYTWKSNFVDLSIKLQTLKSKILSISWPTYQM